MTIKLECVWCNTRNEFNRYVRLNGEGAYVINYMDIVSKLSKADPYSLEPNDRVIGLHLHSAIQNHFQKLEEDPSSTSRLIYVLKNLTPNTVEGLFETLHDQSDELKLCTKLVIINRTDYPRKGVLSKFDTVKFIDK